MAKVKNRGRGTAVVIGVADNSRARFKFGAVTVAAARVDHAVAQRNIEEGQQALERAAKKLSEPGISIRAAKGVPLYFVDEKQPSRLIRKLDGKTERGVLEDGHFKVVHE